MKERISIIWSYNLNLEFEDALRKAVALGADADTLGAITGSIAEALWGIPEWMKQKALFYLPSEMIDVVMKYHDRLNRLRELSKQCRYYRVNGYSIVDEKHQKAWEIEREWAHDLARSYMNATEMKTKMAKLCGMEHWQEWANKYHLPVSLIGYIFKHTADAGSSCRVRKAITVSSL